MSKKRGQNEGSIFEERPGRWVAVITAGYVIRDGKRRRVRKKFVATTRAAVHKKLTKALGRQQRGRNVSPRVQSLSQFLDAWLGQVATQSVRPKTLRTYTDIVNLHIKPALGQIQVEALTPDVVQAFLNDKLGSALCPHCKESMRLESVAAHIERMHSEAKAKPVRDIGAKTVAHIRATLRGALAVAMKWYDLDRNVASIAKPPRVPHKEMRSLTLEEAQAYLEAAGRDRLAALFLVALAGGLRQGEVLGLTWDFVDLENGVVEVRCQLQRVNGKLQLVETKTKEGSRPVDLPAIAVASLISHRASQQKERLFAGDTWKEAGLVFTTMNGTPIDPRHVIRRHHAIVKAAGIPHLRFHDLRHSTASLLLAEFGESRAKYVSEMLGHKQVSFTLQTYQHVIKKAKSQLAERMESMLNPKPVVPVAPQVVTPPLSGVVN